MNTVLNQSAVPNTATQAGIASVLSFDLEGVVLKLVKNHDMSREMAEMVWVDTKRFLYLCGWKNDNSFSMTPTPTIDKGWHEFILFTREYAQFCQTHFGELIHHVPDIHSLVNVNSDPTCSEEGCTFGSCRFTKQTLDATHDCNSQGPKGECGAGCSTACKSSSEPSATCGKFPLSDLERTVAHAERTFGELSENWKV